MYIYLCKYNWLIYSIDVILDKSRIKKLIGINKGLDLIQAFKN